MFNQKILSCLISAATIISTINCTSRPVEVFPGSEVMPYPQHMALKNNLLFVSAVNADDRYSYGRLVAIDTNALNTALKGNGAKTPIPWSSVVTSNTMIPTAAGMMSAEKDLVFTSSVSGRLHKLPMTLTGFRCNNPSNSIDQCNEANYVLLGGLDPLATQVISSTANEEIIAISYWSSSRIDLVSSSNTSMKTLKHFDAADFILKKTKVKISADEIVVAKKIQVNKADANNYTVYFLLERRSKLSSERLSQNGAYLVAIKATDLLNNEIIPDAAITLWDLKGRYYIDGARDFFIDEGTGTDAVKTAYVLSQMPESLYKINLTKDVLIDTAFVCISASSLAVSVANNRILMPCFKDNRIASFTMSPLAIDRTSAIHGQGPIYIVIDENKKYIYVTYYSDGKVAIFDEQLNYLGHVFEPASNNAMGS